jgi:hypothetical protein
MRKDCICNPAQPGKMCRITDEMSWITAQIASRIVNEGCNPGQKLP